MPFEDVMRRLDEIVEKLSSGKQPLADSLRYFEEGIKLLQAADAALAGIEAKAQELMADAGRQAST